MVEADIFCTMGLIFAAFVSLSSMSVYWFFERQDGLDWLADILVLFMIGIGMSAVAWMKVWMAKPSFNTGPSLHHTALLCTKSDTCQSLQYDCDHPFCGV